MDGQDFEGRLSAVERQVRDLDGRLRSSAQDAAAARILAGAADRDVSEFRTELTEFRRATVAQLEDHRRAMSADLKDFRRAATTSFNALRQDLIDQNGRMEQGFAAVDQRFAAVDRGFAEIRGRLDGAAAGQQQIVEMLQTIMDNDGK